MAHVLEQEKVDVITNTFHQQFWTGFGKAQLDQWSSLYGSVVTDNWRELSKPSSLGHSGCESPPLRNQLRLVSIGSSDSSPPSREHCCNLLPSPGTSGRPEVLPFCTRSCSLAKAIPRSCSRSVGNYSIPASSFLWLFLFSDLLSSSLLFSDSSHLCFFPSVHIVGSLTSKLPSANFRCL